jgi:hypothetical protein
MAGAGWHREAEIRARRYAMTTRTPGFIACVLPSRS